MISERKSDRISAEMSNAHKGHARHYKHIEWYIQTAALPVKTGVVILLWGEALRPPRFFRSSHICNTLLCKCIYIYTHINMSAFLHVALRVKTGIVSLLWGEALRPPPIPPPASLFKSHLHYTSVHVCIYIYMCFCM